MNPPPAPPRPPASRRRAEDRRPSVGVGKPGVGADQSGAGVRQPDAVQPGVAQPGGVPPSSAQPRARVRVSPYARVRYGAVAQYGRPDTGESPLLLRPSVAVGAVAAARQPPPRQPPQPPRPPPPPAQGLPVPGSGEAQAERPEPWQQVAPEEHRRHVASGSPLAGHPPGSDVGRGAPADFAKEEPKEELKEELKEEKLEAKAEPVPEEPRHPLEPPPDTTTMVVPAVVAEQVEERREWADQVQQDSGAGLEVKEGCAADAWPEERLVHLKGPLDARIAALEQLLRWLNQDISEDECLVKLLIPSSKVSPCRSDLDRLFQSYGMDAAISKEKVFGLELGVVAASGEVDAVAVGLWELMKTIEKVPSTGVGEGAAPGHPGHAAFGADLADEGDGFLGAKAESESMESEGYGGYGGHLEDEDEGGVDFGGADDGYEEGSRREDDGWGDWGRRPRRTLPLDAPPAPEGLLLAQALPGSQADGGGEADAASVSRRTRTPSQARSEPGDERSPSSVGPGVRGPPPRAANSAPDRPPTPPRSRRQVAAAAAAEAAPGGRRQPPPPPSQREQLSASQPAPALAAEGRRGEDGTWPSQVTPPPPPPRRRQG